MNQAEIICTLLIVVAALAILAKKVALPYPVLLYPPWQNVAIVAWTGMRGVVSLAAALALPLTLLDGSPFPGRDYILFITFCVILATLLLQGLSLFVLIRRLGVAP